MNAATGEGGLLNNLKVGYKLSFIPLIYTLILIGLLAYVVDNARGMLLDSTIQDAAGRQRLLNARYLQEVFLERMTGSSDRGQTAAIFLNTQSVLMTGGEVTINLATGEKVQLPGAKDTTMLALLEEQRRLFDQLVQRSDAFLALEEPSPDQFVALRELSAQLFDNSNALIKRISERSKDKVNELIRNVVILVILTTIAGLVLSLLVSRQITEPLGRVVGAMFRVSQGDLRKEAWEDESTGSDELGQLSTALAAMKSSLRSLISETLEAANSLNAAAAQVAASSQQQAASTAEQMAAVQETTATMEELGQTGHQVSERAREVGATAEATSTASVSGVEAVQTTYKIMEQIREQVQVTAENIVALSEKNKAVRDVISTVNDIAERTNLLALNAAIEAASAGDSGARFSVVAEELKSLADQAKLATGEVRTILEDIEERIHRSVMFTEEAVKRVERGRHEASNAEATIGELNTSTVDSVRAFQQIVASAGQQQIGFEQVVQALQSIRQASEQSALGTKQLDEASSSLGALVEQLLSRTEQFKI